MFEKYLEKVLRELLGEFIEEIDSKDLSVGVWSGKVEIKSLRLKRSVLQKHLLPLYVRHSCLRGLSLKIPWKNLFGSPLVVTIESVLILCEFAGEGMRGQERVNTMLELVHRTIRLVGSQLVQRAKEKAELKQKEGLIDRLTYKMLDNLQLSVRNIHVRFEQPHPEQPLKLGYSFGCSLESIDMFAIGANNQKVFVDRAKLQQNAILRKKIEMKNLAMYCNYGETDFAEGKEGKNEAKALEERLLKTIYRREGFVAAENKNNYVLIMNVSGVVDEEVGEANYDLKLNFEKLVVKLDKEVLNCLLAFAARLGSLQRKQQRQARRRELTREDQLLLRKYCNAYLSDFKAKDCWPSRDRDQFASLLATLPEECLVERVKHVVINQLSLPQLSRFFAVKGQDLDRGLLQVSRQIKDLQPPKICVQVVIPQITLYLVNEFSQSILQLSILGISIGYHEKLIGQARARFVDLTILSISAINAGLYIFSAEPETKEQKFLLCSLESAPGISSLLVKISAFTFHYDFETIFKITELFHLRDVDGKDQVISTIQPIDDTPIAPKLQQSTTKMEVKVVIIRPKLVLREGRASWAISLQELEAGYSQQITLKAQGLRLVLQKEKQEHVFVEPFNIKGTIAKQIINMEVGAVRVGAQPFLLSSLARLMRHLFSSKKNQVISRCSRSCEVFLKQARWQKCFITLLDSRLYAWENDNQYPLFNIHVRSAQKVKRGKVDILEVSDRRKIHEVAFKDQKLLNEWLVVLQKIASNGEPRNVSTVKKLDDSSIAVGLEVESVTVCLSHYRFGKEDKEEISQQVVSDSVLQLKQILLKYVGEVKDSIASSQINLSLGELGLSQDSHDFLTKDSSSNLMKLTIVTHPAQGDQSDQIITIAFQPFQFYYKPAAILKLIGFFNDLSQQNKIPELNYQQTSEPLSLTKLLSKINVHLQEVTLLLENKITQTPIAKLSARDVKILLLVNRQDTVVQGNARALRLYDLTSYPFTIYTPSKQLSIEHSILEDGSSESTIDFTLKLPKQSNIGSTADVVVEYARLNFTFEPVLRIIDYINNQILALLFFPDYFPQFYCEEQPQPQLSYKKYIKKEQELLRMRYLAKLGKDQTKTILESARPLMFNILINKSALNIVGDTSTNLGICLYFEKAIISNSNQPKVYETNYGRLSIPNDNYYIDLRQVRLVAEDDGEMRQVTARVGQQEIRLKIVIQYFGGLLDYKFLHGDDLRLDNQVKVDFSISMATIKLNESIISSVQRALNRNIFQQDNANFLFTFEVTEGPQSILNVSIHSQLLLIELQQLKQSGKVVAQLGGFLHTFQRNPETSCKLVASKYVVLNFTTDSQQHQVLSTRKIFGRSSSIGPLYNQLIRENSIKDLPAGALQYTATTHRKMKKIETSVVAKQLVAMVNMDCLIYLMKLQLRKDNIDVFPPAFHDHLQVSSSQPFDTTTQIQLEKVILCAEVMYCETIISALTTILINIDKTKTQVFVPQLEAFISNRQHINCNELSEIKKRTLLKQTQIKMVQHQGETHLNVGKCFFKISLNDLKNIHLIYTENHSKYQQYSRSKIKEQLGDHVESIEHNVSIKQETKHQINIKYKTPKKIETSHQLKSKEKQRLDTSMELIVINNNAEFQPKSQVKSLAKQYSFEFDTIQLMVVDDLNEFLTPLVYVNLRLDLGVQGRAGVDLYADYFNLRNTLWQPLIERCSLLIDYGQKVVVKCAQPKEFINLNIASNFLQNILKTLSHKELKSSRLLYIDHKVDKDEVNSWILINELGQDIYCESVDQSSKRVFVAKGEVQTLEFLSRGREFKERESEEIFVRIVGQKLMIKKLKVNELGLKRLTVICQESQAVVVKNLYIDLSKNIRYLILSSQIIFKNRSDTPIFLKQNKYLHQIIVPPFKSLSLPCYCGLQSILYCSGNEEDVNYQSLQGLQQLQRVQVNEKVYGVTFNQRKLRKYFQFTPLYRITNYLPFGMLLNFRARDSSSLYFSLDLGSYEQGNHSGYLYKPLQELQVSLYIENYQCTDFFTFGKRAEIHDYSGNVLTLKCEQSKEIGGSMVQISLMVNHIVRNLTRQVFNAFVDNHWVCGVKERSCFISEKNQMVLALNGEKSDLIFLSKKSSSFTIRGKSGLFRTESDYCLYRNNVDGEIPLQRVDFCISELLPMYLFKNNNKFGVVVRQHGSGVGETQAIAAKSEQNLIWFLDGTARRKSPLFKFTIQGGTYEWSCMLNVEIVRKSYFLIRNRFNYLDLRYFIANVRKIKETFEINCKELTQAEIPYIIRNSTERYNIIIDNLKVALAPGEQTYFCWEDPSLSQRRIKVKLVKRGMEGKLRGKEEGLDYEIRVDSFQQENIKGHDDLQVEVVNEINRQVYIFTDAVKDGLKTVKTSSMIVELPIRLGVINNSTSPASHLFDLTSFFKLSYEVYSSSKTVALLELKELQLDNQTKPLTYFPVVLSTNLQVRVEKGKSLQVQVMADSIRVSIQEDFVTDLMSFITHLQSLSSVPSSIPNVLEQHAKEETFFISKLILPQLNVELEVQTRKFSIETTINLQKPDVTSYPWKNAPYPIKTVAINILSHLSISPWAFISSFGRGLSLLITEQQASRGFEGLFQQLVGGCSNSINGMVGMIVGHDIEKVDNFVDGLNKGLWALGTSLLEILPNFQGDYSPLNIIKEVGTSAINLVFKPVTGILRMTLRISEGIKKTTKFQFDLTSKRFKKRFPIVFYSREETFTTYDFAKSEFVNSIRRVLLNELKYFYLVDTFFIEYRLRQEKYCLIVGAEELLYLNIKTEKTLWRLQVQRIATIELHNLCTLHFILYPSPDDDRKRFQVDLNSQEKARLAMQIVQKVRKLSSASG